MRSAVNCSFVFAVAANCDAKLLVPPFEEAPELGLNPLVEVSAELGLKPPVEALVELGWKPLLALGLNPEDVVLVPLAVPKDGVKPADKPDAPDDPAVDLVADCEANMLVLAGFGAGVEAVGCLRFAKRLVEEDDGGFSLGYETDGCGVGESEGAAGRARFVGDVSRRSGLS